MQAPAKLARSTLSAVIDFALPPRCAGCGTIVAAPGTFCFDCWSGMQLLGPPCCTRCALPFEHAGEGELECGACLADPPAFDSLRAAVAYGDLARVVALKLKYGRKPGVAETMAGFMARHVDGPANPLLCPVPLHRWRIWQRGYNQSALIAAALGRSCR
jgi:predicted amidophosphoribosyltransferase